MAELNKYPYAVTCIDKPAHRRAVEQVIEKHNLRELTEKQEAFLDLIGCRPTFDRHVAAACAAAIKQFSQPNTPNIETSKAFLVCDEIHLAAGCQQKDIERINQQNARQRLYKHVVVTFTKKLK